MAIGPGVTDGWTGLIDAMKQLRLDWPRRGWSWDSRVSCVSSSFDASLENEARAVAMKVLAHEWTPQTLPQAPSHVRDVATRAGGLRAGQLVMASPPVGRAFAYGLWWPWGDGLTISLRVGLGDAHTREDVLVRLRDAFGVEV